MNINVNVIADRINRAARGAEGQESDHYGRFLAVRRAVVRALRREFDLPRHGLAPASVFNAASKFARCVSELPGWESSWDAADRAIRPALRRLSRRAKKGTL
jgi:hypothetical protein